jgi:hypothetical protein
MSNSRGPKMALASNSIHQREFQFVRPESHSEHGVARAKSVLALYRRKKRLPVSFTNICPHTDQSIVAAKNSPTMSSLGYCCCICPCQNSREHKKHILCPTSSPIVRCVIFFFGYKDQRTTFSSPSGGPRVARTRDRGTSAPPARSSPALCPASGFRLP